MNTLVKFIGAAIFGLATSAGAQNLPDMKTPNIAAIGFGTGPDHTGSDDYTYAAAPLMRLQFGGERYLSLEGNMLRVNVLNHPNLRAGPIGIYRFGRNRHEDDHVVKDLPKIDNTVELGGFLGYDLQAGSDPRSRWNFGTHFMHDVGDSHNGYVIAGHVMRWMPVGKYGLFGLNAGVTYGSEDYMDTFFSVTDNDTRKTGLKSFNADSGFRDARLIAMFIQPVSRNWAVGVGGMYQRLLGDAADSPIVDDRGSKDQFIAGIGIGRFW